MRGLTLEDTAICAALRRLEKLEQDGQALADLVLQGASIGARGERDLYVAAMRIRGER